MNKDNERITYDEFMMMFKIAPSMCYTLYEKAEDEIEKLKKQKDDVVEGLKDLRQFVYDELVDFNVRGATETHCKVMNLLRMLGEKDE